jgi:hypothetical protein
VAPVRKAQQLIQARANSPNFTHKVPAASASASTASREGHLKRLDGGRCFELVPHVPKCLDGTTDLNDRQPRLSRQTVDKSVIVSGTNECLSSSTPNSAKTSRTASR